MGLNLSPHGHKSNTKPLSYRTKDENSRSNSLLTLKCELLFQTTEQSYSSLFTLTIGFIPMSIKRLLGDVSREKLAHEISAVQGLFLELFETKQWKDSSSVNCIIEVHIANTIKESKFNWYSSHKFCMPRNQTFQALSATLEVYFS